MGIENSHLCIVFMESGGRKDVYFCVGLWGLLCCSSVCISKILRGQKQRKQSKQKSEIAQVCTFFPILVLSSITLPSPALKHDLRTRNTLLAHEYAPAVANFAYWRWFSW